MQVDDIIMEEKNPMSGQKNDVVEMVQTKKKNVKRRRKKSVSIFSVQIVCLKLEIKFSVLCIHEI